MCRCGAEGEIQTGDPDWHGLWAGGKVVGVTTAPWGVSNCCTGQPLTAFRIPYLGRQGLIINCSHSRAGKDARVGGPGREQGPREGDAEAVVVAPPRRRPELFG